MRKLPAISNFQKKVKRTNKLYTPPLKCGILLAFVTLGLVLFGLTMLYSTTSGNIGATLLLKQTVWVLLGITGAALVVCIGYKKLLAYSTYFVWISAILLIVARFSRPINGAYRWINLPGGIGNIQPSELAKLSLIMFLAYYLSKYQRQINSSFKYLLYPLMLCIIILGLILIGKDLGTTILLFSVIWFLLFAAGIKLLYLIIPLLVVPAIPYLLKHYNRIRWVRITSFLNPERFQQSTGYQLWLSILALGSGSWSGLGFAQSRMKAEYLPEAHTDFILSIVGEELGYISLLSIIAAYVLFLILSIFISTRAKNKEGMLLCFGLSSIIALQAIINIGVVSGAFPTKGMPAPFISYGGSNMIICLISVGFILSVSNDKNIRKTKKGSSSKLREINTKNRKS